MAQALSSCCSCSHPGKVLLICMVVRYGMVSFKYRKGNGIVWLRREMGEHGEGVIRYTGDILGRMSEGQ